MRLARPALENGLLPLIVALEGACLTGKTTLARNLTTTLTSDGATVLNVPCYADQTHMPLPDFDVHDTRAQHDAMRFYLTLEAGRVRAIQHARDADLVLLDRSIETLLANTLALDDLHQTNMLPVMQRMVSDAEDVLRPDLTLHLTIPPDVAVQRATSRRPALPPLMVDGRFSQCVDRYFTGVTAHGA